MATPRIPVHHAQEPPIGGKLPSYFLLKSLTQSFPLEWRDVLRYRRLRKLHANLHAALTDNGSCYRSKVFADALGDIEHRRTRPYRPQTNGKVERFHRTLADEWAYARLYRTDTQRCQEFTTWLHTYNYHRAHTALGGQPPATRVPNLSGQYI